MSERVYIPIGSDGRLGNISSIQKISPEDWSLIQKIVNSIAGIFANKTLTIFLRGSVAYGKPINKISDLDFVVIADSFSEGEKDQVSSAVQMYNSLLQERYSLVDISCVQTEMLTMPENNRLYMNITLTGIELFNNGLELNLPQPYFSKSLATRIFRQTKKDCFETYERIQNRSTVEYMGKTRGADFLCVWFMRDYIRGLLAFVMLKKRSFSLNVATCAYEFSECYPEYRDFVCQLQKAEISPISDWDSLKEVCHRALDLYDTLIQRFYGGK